MKLADCEESTDAGEGPAMLGGLTMYYLTEKDRKACAYFASIESYSETQAENAIRFCCSICGCNREEQTYLLDWYFDGYYADMVSRPKSGAYLFRRLLDYCGDAWIVTPEDPNYTEYSECFGEECMISVEPLPTGNLFVTNI